jgi:hypothetical protein
MALLFMESFDGYGGNTSYMPQYYHWPILMTDVVRTGSHSMRNGLGRNISPSGMTLIFGFAFYRSSSHAQGIISFSQIPSNSGNFTQYLAQVTLDTDGKVRVYLGSSTLLDTTSTAPLISGSWNYIEAKLVIADAGSWTIKVNGVTVLTGTGDLNPGATSIGSMYLDISNSNRLDDFYLLDASGSSLNDFIGDCRVEWLAPQTGNGSNVGLTPSTGTDHGALVDELPPNDDTDYNSGTAAGVKDTYNFSNLATTGVVKAVQLSARAKKTDSATKQLALVARVGSTDYDGATQTLAATTYGQYQQIWEKRPSDNADWTIADVDGAEFGLKVVS